jgi:hypothetical protein
MQLLSKVSKNSRIDKSLSRSTTLSGVSVLGQYNLRVVVSPEDRNPREGGRSRERFIYP